MKLSENNFSHITILRNKERVKLSAEMPTFKKIQILKMRYHSPLRGCPTNVI